ncbi:MAG: glycosyltransferase family 4 protein [Candidatus Omnitrophota bacterium]|nr:glycosyltransferase family 4 protein [Candidatus Omnitrophota bacterium]
MPDKINTKILFIVPYPTQGPSNRFRVEQYLPYLKEAGIDFTLRPFYNSSIYRILYKKGNYFKNAVFLIFFTLRRIKDIFASRLYDVTFIHREAFPSLGYLFEVFFRLFSKKLVYDFDDAVFLKKPAKTRKTIEISDYVIAGNSFLKGYAAKHNSNVAVIPTCIDTDRYKPRPRVVNNDKLVIGWIGTSFTSIYLDLLRDVFREIARRYKNVEFRIIGANFLEPGIPLVSREWSLSTEIEDLQGFDIGIMPLFDDDWAKGKCAFKIIQYMAVGIPTVASKVGMNIDVIEDGVNGFLVSDKKGWLDRLVFLIDNADIREKLGRAGRMVAETKYSVKANAPILLELLNFRR